MTKPVDLPFGLRECTVPVDGSQWPLGLKHTFKISVVLVQNAAGRPLSAGDYVKWQEEGKSVVPHPDHDEADGWVSLFLAEPVAPGGLVWMQVPRKRGEP